jgi:Spy/CpxP family protein refolding chaperone
MRRLFAVVVAMAVTVGAASVSVAKNCCPGEGAKKAEAPAEGKAGCGDKFAKLNLSDEQKAKVNALMQQCQKATSKSECREMMSSGLEKILTPEQMTQWKADCEKMNKANGECPYMKSHKKS